MVRRSGEKSGLKEHELRRVLQRLAVYSREAGVRFEVAPRHREWGEFGLPDLRGFTPHLRTVRTFAGEAVRWPAGFDELETSELWLLHDLAHVIWYDAATLAFGTERWNRRGFFVEHHLASEAFAVLLLDYHVLSRTRHHGLAVDLDGAAWDEMRTRMPALPALDSYAMTRELVELYFTGDSALFFAELDVDPDDAALLERWRGHERSYSDKQRGYVLDWWRDLARGKGAAGQAIVEGSALAELLFVTLRRFTTDSDAAFRAHVDHAASRLAEVANVLRHTPKYRGNLKSDERSRDFRFTDVLSVDPKFVLGILRRADEPDASALFLFWQLLGASRPESLSSAERAAVRALAASCQTTAPDVAAWAIVRSACERLVVEERWIADPKWRACFFLP